MTYTPSTDEVREAIAEWAWSRRMFRPELAQSDGQEAARWLDAHDAEVAAKALREAADEYASGQLAGFFLGRDEYPKAWLRDRAERLEGR